MIFVIVALFLPVFIGVTSVAMHKESTTPLCAYIESRYAHTINNDLLKALDAPNPKKLLEQIQHYYVHQPAQQKTYTAYISKPLINMKKCSAYLALIRATSLDVRESTPQEELEEGPVDTKIMPQVHKEWPIVSVMYDLQEMQGKMHAFHDWIMRFPASTENNDLPEFLKKLAKDYTQTSHAITICSTYKEHLNKRVSFENSNE